MNEDNTKHKIILNGYPIIDIIDGKRFVHFNFFSTMGCVCGITDEAMENINLSIASAELGGKIGQAHARKGKCTWSPYYEYTYSTDYQLIVNSLTTEPFNDVVEVNSPFFEVKEGTTIAQIFEIMQNYYKLLDPAFQKYSIPVEVESTDIISGIVEKQLTKPIKPQHKGAFAQWLHRKEYVKYEQDIDQYYRDWRNKIAEVNLEVYEAFNDERYTPKYKVTPAEVDEHMNAISTSYLKAYKAKTEPLL